jgi:hypothetical protein
MSESHDPKRPSKPTAKFVHVLEQVARYIERSFVIPERYGMLVDGSAAEGFGNARSDIDVTIVLDDDEPVPGAAFVAICDVDDASWRVEVRYRRASDLVRLGASLDELEIGTRRGANTLFVYHRIGCGYVVRSSAALQRALDGFDHQRLRELVARHWLRLATEAQWRCEAALWLGREACALTYARQFLTRAVQAWAAERGETCPSSKWLTLMLRRAGMSPGMIDRYRGIGLNVAESSAGDLAADVHRFVAQLGLEGTLERPAGIALRTQANVSTWDVGADLYLVLDRHDVFKLRSDVVALWRSRLQTAGSELDLAQVGPDERVLLGALHRHGLVTVHSRGGDFSWADTPALFNSEEKLPCLTARGVDFVEPWRGPVRWVPIPARRLAESGAHLVYHAMRVESWLEDAVGACRDEQWGVLTNAFHQMVREACCVLLASKGMPGVALEESVERLQEQECVDQGIRLEARQLLCRAVANAAEASALQTAVGDFLARMGPKVMDPAFRGIYARTVGYVEALHIAAQWKALGRLVDVRIPHLEIDAAIEENVSMLEGTGSTRFGMKLEALQKLLQFERELRIV